MNGEEETGVSIMLMDEGLDTGPVALKKKIPLGPDTNAGELTQSLARLGAKAIVEALSAVESGAYNLTRQDEGGATYASKLSAEDRIIRWALPARKIHDQIRALAPRIGARTFHPTFDGPVKILCSQVVEESESAPPVAPSGSILAAKENILVQCGAGTLLVEELQVPGGKSVAAEEFLRGNELEGAFTGNGT